MSWWSCKSSSLPEPASTNWLIVHEHSLQALPSAPEPLYGLYINYVCSFRGPSPPNLIFCARLALYCLNELTLPELSFSIPNLFFAIRLSFILLLVFFAQLDLSDFGEIMGRNDVVSWSLVFLVLVCLGLCGGGGGGGEADRKGWFLNHE